MSASRARFWVTLVALAVCAVLVRGTGTAFPRAIVHLKGYEPLTIVLRPDAAPLTVKNFIHLARTGFYNTSCEFYRLHKGFVLQGGNLMNASNSTVPLEYHLPNVQYSVGLARAAAANTGSSEFYINLVDNSRILAPNNQSLGYAVFGEVRGNITSLLQMEALPVYYNATIGTTMPVDPPQMKWIEIIDA